MQLTRPFKKEFGGLNSIQLNKKARLVCAVNPKKAANIEPVTKAHDDFGGDQIGGRKSGAKSVPKA